MTRHTTRRPKRDGQERKYPRMARVNEVVRETLGDELERLNDPRIGLVTITGVDVSADLRQATVYYSALGRAAKRGAGVVPDLAPEQREATQAALRSAAPHLRAELGRQVRLKYLPELTFREDPAIATGERIEEILRGIHRDDVDVGVDVDADGDTTDDGGGQA